MIGTLSRLPDSLKELRLDRIGIPLRFPLSQLRKLTTLELSMFPGYESNLTMLPENAYRQAMLTKDVFHLKNLEWMRLQDFHLSSIFLDDMSRLTNLAYLRLDRSYGNLTVRVVQFDKFKTSYVDAQHLTEALPDQLTRLTN